MPEPTVKDYQDYQALVYNLLKTLNAVSMKIEDRTMAIISSGLMLATQRSHEDVKYIADFIEEYIENTLKKEKANGN